MPLDVLPRRWQCIVMNRGNNLRTSTKYLDGYPYCMMRGCSFALPKHPCAARLVALVTRNLPRGGQAQRFCV
jgi:hypothetical protein